MPIKTTCIGAFPKPDYVPIKDWFKVVHADESYTDITKALMDEKEQKVYTGFIAQEVEAAALQTGFDFSGVNKPTNDQTPYSLVYSEFVVPLVKSIQEQQEMIEQLMRRVAELEEGIVATKSSEQTLNR